MAEIAATYRCDGNSGQKAKRVRRRGERGREPFVRLFFRSRNIEVIYRELFEMHEILFEYLPGLMTP